MRGNERTAEKRNSRRELTFLLTFLIFSSYLNAAGTTSAEFLNLIVGARPAAMGGAFGAVSDDLNAVFSNPAGLGLVDNLPIALHHIEGLANIQCETLAIGYRPADKKLGTLAVSLLYIRYGEFIGRTNSGHKSRNFTASDDLLIVSYGNNICRTTSAGMSIKFIEQEIAGFKACTIAGDLGIFYQYSSLKLGLGIYNLGTDIKFIKESAPLPTRITLSAAYRPLASGLTVATDFNLPVREKPYLNLGMEYAFGRILSARFGLCSYPNNVRLSCGFGLSLGSCSVDYAFLPFGALGNIHQISLNFRFGRGQ